MSPSRWVRRRPARPAGADSVPDHGVPAEEQQHSDCQHREPPGGRPVVAEQVCHDASLSVLPRQCASGQEFAVSARQIGVATYGADMSSHARVRLRLTWRQRRAFVVTVLVYQVLVWSDVLLNQGRFGGNTRTAIAGAVFLAMAADHLVDRHVADPARPGRARAAADGDPVAPGARDRGADPARQQDRRRALRLRRLARHCPAYHVGGADTGPLGRDEEFQDKVRVLRSFWAAHRDRAAA